MAIAMGGDGGDDALEAGIALRVDGDALAVLAPALVLHDAVDLRPEGEVAAAADVDAGVEARADLAHEHVAREHFLAAVDLHAAALRLGVAAVAGRALSLFVCHGFFLSALRP